VQTCVVHLIRASLRYVNYRDLKKVTAALRPIYTAANADAARLEFELSTSRAPFEHELLQAARVRNRAKPRRDEQSSAGRTPAADRGRRVDRCPCAGHAG
jgi:hypothetical protein